MVPQYFGGRGTCLSTFNICHSPCMCFGWYHICLVISTYEHVPGIYKKLLLWRKTFQQFRWGQIVKHKLHCICVKTHMLYKEDMLHKTSFPGRFPRRFWALLSTSVQDVFMHLCNYQKKSTCFDCNSPCWLHESKMEGITILLNWIGILTKSKLSWSPDF